MAEVAAGAAVATALVQAKTAIWDPLMQTIESSNDMDEISGVLDSAMRKLVAKRADLENMVQRHKTSMMPSNIHTNWNSSVNEVENEVKKLQIKYTKQRKKSFKFSFFSRSNFTKKMKKTASKVIALLNEDTDFADILVDKKPACVVKLTTPSITDIPTLRKPLEQTLVWLCDSKVRGVRIYGFVGSGKTTIMRNLNNHATVAEMFDIVIWVTVSRGESMKNRDIDQIQQDIVQRLKLDIEATTHFDLIAIRIKEELENIKYLLLLDDVKEELNLQKIGVPISENGSKIVFTTRSRHVCSSIATRKIKVAKIDEQEALDMFKSVLDRPHLAENSNIKRLMPLIVEWCGYHPLMISVAAGVFRVKETEERWHDAYKNLRKWPDRGDDTMQEIYKLLKCCFDFLEVTQKKCFFYSALYLEDSDIQKDSLLDNWAAERLLDTVSDVENDVEEIGIRGRDMLDHLKMLSLLEENAFQQSIRMHKLIRLAALHSLSNEDQQILVKSGETLQRSLNADCWKDKKWISLGDSIMNALPDQPYCPTLSTLFLQKNPKLEVIPRAFFEDMGGLHVLDLYDTRIKSLPSSLLTLVTLKVLYLQKCVALVELPSDIGKLGNLEVLDIRGSGLAKIPPQVENLICLRRLLVSFTTLLSTNPIPYIEVISKLPMLKELVIDVEEGLESTLYGLLVNGVKLTSLSLLQFCSPNKVVDVIKVVGDIWKISFPTEGLLQSYINKVGSFELENSQFFIRCDISSLPHIMEFMPYVKFDGEVSDNTISQVLGNYVAIEFVNHNQLEHLSKFTTANLNKIRSCVIKDCNTMRTIVDGNMGGNSILNNLEQLHMINLPVLKSVSEGRMQGLTRLKTLILCKCSMLTSVCTYGIILQLPEICHLEVKECSEIKEIFKGSPNVVSPMLPKLKKLILVDMPQLTSILVSNSFEWPSLERLKILGCHKLKRLPFQRDGAVNLESIEAEKSWWEALENDQEVKEQFLRYCTLS